MWKEPVSPPLLPKHGFLSLTAWVQVWWFSMSQYPAVQIPFKYGILAAGYYTAAIELQKIYTKDAVIKIDIWLNYSVKYMNILM